MKRFWYIITVLCLILHGSDILNAQEYSYGIDPQKDERAVKIIRARMDSIEKHRPTVALVLSGGGAKGASHIGVLRYLESIQMPIDLIVGTSMGGLIGGFYSAGHSSAVIDSAIRRIDWGVTLSDRIPRKHISYSEKMYKRRYNLSVPFYYAQEKGENKKGVNHKIKSVVNQLDDIHLGMEEDDGLIKNVKENIMSSLPSGFVYGQNVNNLFTSYTVGYHDELPFWELPIPFVCVATEMVSSKPKIWYSGKLNDALRSTMAIPGLFTPVRTDGMVLLDGGMRNNYPTDIARDLGADYVIGVDLSEGYKDYEEIRNLLDIMMQGVDMLGRASYEKNTDLTDVTIKPDISQYNMLSFDAESIDDLIHRGEQAAISVGDELMAIKEKVGDQGMTFQAAPAKNLSLHSVKIDTITVSGLSPEEGKMLLNRLKVDVDENMTKDEIEEIVASMYGTRSFDSVRYELLGENEPYKLNFICKKGPINQVGISARMDSDEIVSVLLNLGFNVHNVSGNALELTGKLGTNPYAKLHYYYRTNAGPTINVTAAAKYVAKNKFSFGEDLFNVEYINQRNEVYMSNIRWINLDLNIGVRYDYFRVGSLMQEGGNSDESIVNFDKNIYLSSFLNGKADTFDDGYFPNHGFSLGVDYSWVFGGLHEKIKAFHYAQFNFKTVANLGGVVSVLPFANARLLFGEEIPTPYVNVIGGRLAGRYLDQHIPFMGVTNSAAVSKYLAIVGAELRARVYKNNYISAIVNVGDSAPTFKDMTKMSSAFIGAGLEYSYNSIVGPIRADIHWSSLTKSVGCYLSLGFDF